MATLLIASGNIGKLREIQAILDGFPVDPLVLPSQIGIHLEVEEDGKTYAENAAKESPGLCRCQRPDYRWRMTLAWKWMRWVGSPVCILPVMPPGKAPPTRDRRQLLAAELAGKPRPWTAHFHCTVAIAKPEGALFFAEGNCPGEIIP